MKILLLPKIFVVHFNIKEYIFSSGKILDAVFVLLQTFLTKILLTD